MYWLDSDQVTVKPLICRLLSRVSMRCNTETFIFPLTGLAFPPTHIWFSLLVEARILSMVSYVYQQYN